MRLAAFSISFVLGVVGAVSCSSSKKCTPASCSGCCSANDTCETGGATTACGIAGALCDRCVGAQLCVSGKCEGGTNSGGGGGGGTAGGMGGGSVAGTELTGTYQELWGWDADGGRTATIKNFSRARVGVWYRDGGSPDFIRGIGNDDGTFVVRDVPAGEITLQLDKRFFVTTARQLSFDSFIGGRKDAVQATSETTLRLTMRGLQPTSAASSTGFFFTQLGGTANNLENVAVPVTPAGSTSIESDLDWAGLSAALGYGLPDSSKGDKGYAYQNATVTTDAGSFSSLVRAGEFNMVTLVNGGSADAIVDLTPTQAMPYSINVDRAAFTALRGSFGRSVGAAEWQVQIGTSPSAGPFRFSGQGTVTLASAAVNENEPVTLPLPSPFPASWGREVFMSFVVPQPRQATDGGTPTQFFGGLSLGDAAERVTGTIAPRLGPVRGAQIASRNFVEDQSGVTTTPSLSWMAPSTGVASMYRVSISRIDGSGDVQDLWRVYTPSLAVTLPPGVLALGNVYVLELEALSFGEGGISFTLPFARSVVVSGLIRP